MTVEVLIATLQSALTPALLQARYRVRNGLNPLHGHCYVASEALFHLLREYFPSLAMKPCRARDEEGIVHWWLVDESGRILDPTAAQYRHDGREPPYQAGRRAGFLTPFPSKRARIVIGLVDAALVSEGSRRHPAP
jgi:hypothetical protein